MLTIITIAVFHTKKRAWIAVFSRRVCPSIVTQVHDVMMVMMVIMVMMVMMAMMRMMVAMIANDNNGNHTGNEHDDNHDDMRASNPNHGKIVSLRQGHCS